MLFYKFCEIYKNNFFTEHLRATALKILQIREKLRANVSKKLEKMKKSSFLHSVQQIFKCIYFLESLSEMFILI